MVRPSSPLTIGSYWQRVCPYLTSPDWWLWWGSVALFGSVALGSALGRLYFFELFSHFQVQYTVVALALLLANGLRGLIYHRWGRPWVLLLTLALLGWNQTNYAGWWHPGDYDQPILPPQGDVRVYHANVLVTRSEYETTLASLRTQRPDLYVLQEMTPASIRHVTTRLRGAYPHWFACWSKKRFWILVGSRTPIRVDTALARNHQLITLTTVVNGQPMALVTVHPRIPLLPSWFRGRNAQLAEAARRTRYHSLPALLIGDFNISIFSPVYADVFGPPNAVPATAGRSNIPALISGRHTRTQPTWPTFFPPLQLPIDHAFVNAGFQFSQFRTLPQTGSDHRALLVDLRFAGRP
ncbi:endonuclease/exonuclease/phosphatase family protein [Spirosoma sordidisoli]|uniref:endonuclease/exonuclease/phosphatase family protein n=1 Tax=Spirosoma sordidisoli TaxID=2502893 RepID=UPI00101C8F20|nr:endonuclease/exonuclease/phosphatase family protein [Spirosoma sordidisoli]